MQRKNNPLLFIFGIIFLTGYAAAFSGYRIGFMLMTPYVVLSAYTVCRIIYMYLFTSTHDDTKKERKQAPGYSLSQ